MLEQRIAQKLQQKLSPQQIQLMKLLQIPTATLEQRVEEELEANPALEEGKLDEENDLGLNKEDGVDENEHEEKQEASIEEYFDDEGEFPEYKDQHAYYSSSNESQQTIPVAVGTTFHEHLLKQLGVKSLDRSDHALAEQLIGSIEDDGYLRRELENIVDDLAFSRNIHTNEQTLEEILKIVHSFDPPGVGARSLKECLLLQLERKESTPPIRVALKILTNHFDAFSKKHFNKLKIAYDLDDESLKSVLDEILKLNPKPGSTYSDRSSKTQYYIIPDFIVKNENGNLQLTLNTKNAPELKVSHSFRDMYEAYKASDVKSARQKKEMLFIKQKIDAAKWFIEAIQQRQQTMILVMKAILVYQQEYFLSGDEAKLKPMILKDIAEMTNMDVSTVSRVANSKYVQTEFGTILLKFFFSESVQTASGEDVSTREVKSMLQDIVGQEDKKQPYSDQTLMEMLKEKGYTIARRTVAKYREQLHIPVARLRKEL